MAKWKTLGVVVLSVAIGVIPANAQRSGEGAKRGLSKLTPQDYLDIQQLVNHYAYAIDLPGDNGFALADLFTPDGEFVNGEETIKGREALARFGRRTKKPEVGISQFLMNQIVKPSPEGATGKQYLITVNAAAPTGPEFGTVGGHYEDVYVKTTGGWRFKRREFIQIKAAPGRARGGAAQTVPPPAGR